MSVMKDTPTIISDRLVLRPIVATDAEDMWQDINDPEAIRLTGTHTSFTFEQIERYAASRVEQDDWWDLAVTKRDGGRYLGEVVLMDWDEDNRSCGFRIALSGHARDRGVGTEATRMLLDHAFANLRCTACHWKCSHSTSGPLRSTRRLVSGEKVCCATLCGGTTNRTTPS